MRKLSADQVEAVAGKIYRDWLGAGTDGGSFESALRRAVEAGHRLSAVPQGMGLTKGQHELLAYIQRYVASKGFPPSFDEMKVAMGLRSKSGIHRMIVALEERGAITRMPNRARAIELLAAA